MIDCKRFADSFGRIRRILEGPHCSDVTIVGNVRENLANQFLPIDTFRRREAIQIEILDPVPRG
jgi:hypothetical protein